MLTGESPVAWSFIVAFVSSLLFFLQLRIADEFKDAEEDALYRPYRAVPRGLIRLKELGAVFAISAVTQLVLALTFVPSLAIVLILAWSYLALMSVEFFARDWLKSRPITYLWTHMLIMPIVDFYATACHWIPSGQKPWTGLLCFLAASFFNGLVIEIGRKLRQPSGEENGVPTYSKLWGLRNASWVWFGCLCSTAAFAIAASSIIHFTLPVVITLTPLLCFALKLVTKSQTTSQKSFETLSGIWTLCLYLILGVIPFLVQ
jgi:4-hydroxybenzoate polyprenyltransferase